MNYKKEKLLYQNNLEKFEDIKDFIMEGEGKVTFENNKMRLSNTLPKELGQKANFVYWCPLDFPDNIEISWDFYPLEEPGLCILFFASKGKNNLDLFNSSLQKRSGEYPQYHHGDINALHVSYFRRNSLSERAFNVCNLRKSYGFHLVCQGADPIPTVADATPPYRIKVVKSLEHVLFYINDLLLFHWIDDEKEGEILTDGKIGFRQMAPLIGEYSNLTVHKIERC